MDLISLHVCEQYVSHPDGKKSLIGIFNIIDTPVLPVERTFYVVAHFQSSPAEVGLTQFIGVRSRSPSGLHGNWRTRVVMKKSRDPGFPPHLWWPNRVETVFEEPGYSVLEATIEDAEVGRTERLLVRHRPQDRRSLLAGAAGSSR